MLRRCLILTCAALPVQALGQADILVSIEPTLKRDRDGGLIMEAQTNLPDGFKVMVTLQSVKGPLLGQVDGVVTSGKIVGGPFTNRGTAHAPGVYIVSISSALPDLQPQSIRNITGQRGERLTGAHVARSRSGNRVDFQKNLTAP